MFTALISRLLIAGVKKKFEDAWGVEDLDDKPGLTITDMMTAAQKGELKALYVMGENPLMSDPDTSHIEQALSNLDLLVVQDIFLSETAAQSRCRFAGGFLCRKRRHLHQHGKKGTAWSKSCFSSGTGPLRLADHLRNQQTCRLSDEL